MTASSEGVPSWVKTLYGIEWDLGTAVLSVPPDRVAPVNRAIQRVRQAIPHDFVEGYVPPEECAYCWLPRTEHICGEVGQS